MLVKIEQEGGVKSIKIAEASDGLNAYQLAVKNDGFVGDYDAWKITLKGDKGDAGNDADVTSANIATALTYTPADDSKVVKSVNSNLPDVNGNVEILAGGGAYDDTAIRNDFAAADDLKEDDLGTPDTDGKILSSTISGIRSWITPGGAGTVNGVVVSGNANAVSGGVVYESIKNNVSLVSGKNLIDKNALSNGFYIQFQNGVKSSLANYSSTDYIALKPNTQYTLSVLTDANAQFALYNSSKVYTEGFAANGLSYTFTTGANSVFGRFSLKNVATGHQLEEGAAKTAYEDYGFYIPLSSIPINKFNRTYFTPQLKNDLSLKTILTVKPSGGDYTDLRTALDFVATQSSATNQYEVQIAEGTYDVFAAAIAAGGTIISLTIPVYTTLKAIGQKSKTIIKGALPDNASAQDMDGKSTIHLLDFSGMENLTITARNLRYAVHDDYSNGNSIRRVKNCDLIKYAGVAATPRAAYGGGTQSGDRMYFEDCSFFSEIDAEGFFIHNFVGQANPAYYKFTNCHFGGLYGKAVKLQSQNSGTLDKVDFIGCRFNGNIDCNNATFDWDINGYGNDQTIVTFSVAASTYNFQGEHIKSVNKSAAIITKGSAVRLMNTGGVQKMGAGDDISRFYGVATQDIAINGTGIVRVKGFLLVTGTGLTISEGDKIGITNGALAIVTGAEYIGVAVSSTYIKLK